MARPEGGTAHVAPTSATRRRCGRLRPRALRLELSRIQCGIRHARRLAKGACGGASREGDHLWAGGEIRGLSGGGSSDGVGPPAGEGLAVAPRGGGGRPYPSGRGGWPRTAPPPGERGRDVPRRLHPHGPPRLGPTATQGTSRSTGRERAGRNRRTYSKMMRLLVEPITRCSRPGIRSAYCEVHRQLRRRAYPHPVRSVAPGQPRIPVEGGLRGHPRGSLPIGNTRRVPGGSESSSVRRELRGNRRARLTPAGPSGRARAPR